jgi:energy-coupling factor transporter ATP-binding protein EcfA2
VETPSAWAVDLGSSIESALQSRGKHFWSTSQKGEKWLTALCPFHPDREPSGRWQPGTLTFFCHACSASFTLLELAHALNIDPKFQKPQLTVVAPPAVIAAPMPMVPSESPSSAPDRNPELELPGAPVRFYYTHPDGRPSHYVERVEEPGGGKHFPAYYPDGTPGMPPDAYPVYQVPLVPEGALLLIVEGEKCVQAVATVHDQLEAPIHALTWVGGAGQAKKHAWALAAAVKELKPIWVLLWPDNDEPGYKAMEAIGRALQGRGVRYSAVRPAELQLGLKADVVDYLAEGKSLAAVYTLYREDHDAQLIQAMAQVVVFSGNRMALPTRAVVPIEPKFIDQLWLSTFQEIPTRKQVRTLQSTLQEQSQRAPMAIAYRMHGTATSFTWRATMAGKAIQVSAQGVTVADDPPGVYLTVPDAEPRYPTGIQPGTQAQLAAWLDRFGLDARAKIMVEAWLLSALMRRQTPMLYLRGPAGTGKTTLARTLVGLIDPMVPQMIMRADQEAQELLLIAEQASALLLDNVGFLPAGIEDRLAGLITGESQQMRVMYTQTVRAIRLQRAFVLTTISYDIYQSDLADRVIPLETKVTGGFTPDHEMERQFVQDAEAIRGYLFARCAEFYRRRQAWTVRTTPFRIGDYGEVLDVMGEDVAALATAMRQERKSVVSQNDARLEAIVAIYQTHADANAGSFSLSTSQLVEKIRERTGVADLTVDGLGRYLQIKGAQFRDYGFELSRERSSKLRLWRFIPIQAGA